MIGAVVVVMQRYHVVWTKDMQDGLVLVRLSRLISECGVLISRTSQNPGPRDGIARVGNLQPGAAYEIVTSSCFVHKS
jgi:hypothetical protein